MVSRNGKPPGPADSGSDEPKGQATRPTKPIHAHDEFELDIDVDGDFVQTMAAKPLDDLFADEEEEKTEEITLEQLEEMMRPGDDSPLEIPLSPKDEVLPIFMPSPPRQNRPVPPPPEPSPPPLDPPPQQQSGPRIALPDMSDMFEDEPSLDLPVAPDDDDLFGDVSGMHDEAPVHSVLKDLGQDAGPDKPLTPIPLQNPPTGNPNKSNKRLFGSGFTGGMAPLDIAQFEGQDADGNGPGGKGKRRKKKKTTIRRKAPAPMATSQRVVRRFNIGFRDILLLILILIIGIGIFIGWRIWQDYKDQVNLTTYDQGRYQMEQAREDAIERSQPKKEEDIP